MQTISVAAMDWYIVCVILIIVSIIAGVQLFWSTDEGFGSFLRLYSSGQNEGYEDVGSLASGAFIGKFFPKRGDIGEFEEEAGYRRDDRYAAVYADVQNLGANMDFCRMVEPEGGGPKDAFFACALAGTENLSGTTYRTETVGEGFERSRDDYMSEPVTKGRQNYCRIVKTADGNFEALCRRALDRRFGKKDVPDVAPPARISRLLNFYTDVMIWLRFRDDMVDYARNLMVMRNGGISIDEKPLKPDETTEGLRFDGINQFLRLGENQSLEFGEGNISLRSMRAISFWVKFDRFTNNAHIFDFGSGAGKDNVFCGIIGRGNPTVNRSDIRDLLCDTGVLPTQPSGQQPVFTSPYDSPSSGCVQAAGGGCASKLTDGAELMRPQTLMVDSPANVDDWSCPAPEVVGRRMAPLQPKALPQGVAQTADIIYEIWDRRQRKMQMKVSNAVTLGQWTHITITATNNDAFRPDLAIYINGAQATTKPSGFLPQTSYTTHNYLGKSNWADQTSQYDNRDELFAGHLFDFRAYQAPMSFEKIMETLKWGSGQLGIPVPGALPSDKRARAGDAVVPVNELPNYIPLEKQKFTLDE